MVHTPDTTEVIDHSSGDNDSEFEKDWKEVQEAATNGVIDQLERMAITQSNEGKVQLRNSFFQKALELQREVGFLREMYDIIDPPKHRERLFPLIQRHVVGLEVVLSQYLPTLNLSESL